MPVLLRGAGLTLQLSSVTLVFGTILGLIFALMRLSRRPWLYLPAVAYVELFRSVPVLLQLFLFYYAVPLVLRIDIPSYPAAILALSLYCGAFMTEVIRTGVESVPPGQWEASYSLGMRYPATVRYILMPQALRVALPPMINVYVSIIKDSSLVSVIGYMELTGAGLAVRESSVGRGTLGVLLVVAALYFVIAYTLSLAGQGLERRIRI
jgi:polar amino acid transport system permease protein